MGLLQKLFGRPSSEQDSAPEQSETILINAYSTLRDLPALDFPHQIVGKRDLSDPELKPHLDGLIGYLMGRGDGQMSSVRYHLWRHAQRVRTHLSLQVSSRDLGAFETWAHSANAVLFFPDGSLRAPNFAVLIGADGQSDPQAALPYPNDAQERLQRSVAYLSELGLQPARSMPPALGEAEAQARSPQEVLGRASALLYIAAQARSLLHGSPLGPAGQQESNPLGFASLSEAERTFLTNDTEDESALNNMVWRAEAANALLWALNLGAVQIGESDHLADPDQLWQSLAGHATDQVALRPLSELLDALDRTWREHWIIRQARNTGMETGPLNGDVVAERHLALNWLLSFHNDLEAPWDEVDTPT